MYNPQILTERVVTELGGRLERYAWKLARNQMDAEDLLQETYLRIHRCEREGGNLPEEELLWTWSCRIMKNHYKDTYRKRKARVEECPLYENTWCNRETTVLEHVEGQELRGFLEKGIEKLSPKKRRIILLIIEGKEMREISEITGFPLGTVLSSSHSARHYLTGYVQRKGYDIDSIGRRTG